MGKFANKYRIETARLQKWDYGWNGSYFVTICTENRENYFGNIIDGIMEFSDMGNIANNLWQEITQQFPFIGLDAYVVMPNHVHGIILINKMDDGRDAINRVSTYTTKTIHPGSTLGGITGLKNPMLNENLPRVIRWFKGRTTFECRKINAGFAWQLRYHDHLIRNEKSYQHIKEYIIANPRKWNEDTLNKTNKDNNDKRYN